MEPVDLARELRVGVSRLRRRLREVARLEELTPSQTAVLSRLRDAPQGTSDLAVAEGVRPQSMAATVAALEARGFLARRRDPDDGRRRLLVLTDAAQTYINDSRALRESWLAAALQERYTAQERRTVAEALRLLERLTER